jgi:competence protein ComEC
VTRFLFALLLVLSLDGAWALELHFIDVGQGDAVLIRSASGQTALYDGGRSAGTVLAYLRSVGVESLDLVIASHADADHIGGLIEVVNAYRPRFFMDNGIPHTTATYLRLLEAVAAAGSQYLEATPRRIGMGDVTLHVLAPPGEPTLGQNDNSIGVVVEYGTFRAVLTGDASEREFEWWSRRSPDLLTEATIYKASHHGSSNGDTRASLDAFQPEAVIISVGANNSYGHPTEEASLLYQSVAERIFRTDLQGTLLVHAQPDGTYLVQADRDAPAPSDQLLAMATVTSPEEHAGGASVLIECILFNPADRDDGKELVTLRAIEQVDVTGWVLKDKADHRFHLPARALAPGEAVMVPNTGRPVWNNDGDTAFLYDYAGQLVDSFSYSWSGSRACVRYPSTSAGSCVCP